MTRSMATLAVMVLVGVQAILLAIALRGDGEAGAVPQLPINPAPIPAEVLTIETALPLADSVARAWRDDSALVSAVMEVIWDQDAEVVVPTTVAPGGAMTLVYAAGDAQLSLLMDRRSGVIFHAEEGAWSHALATPLPIAAIARSSSIAVLAAEVSYGTSYRAACPEHRFVTRIYLARSPTDAARPVWVVSYVDERHRDRPDLEIDVDAVTGKTVGGEAVPLGCDNVE